MDASPWDQWFSRLAHTIEETGREAAGTCAVAAILVGITMNAEVAHAGDRKCNSATQVLLCGGVTRDAAWVP
ncbi:hypothetical protein [Nonomuraea sp. NPDC049480]|uniref:hypothetical protein n=1 Tax=Nonomuraea sp. NPDC049480 TaxID=3364353 RepID=UPI0037B8F6D7